MHHCHCLTVDWIYFIDIIVSVLIIIYNNNDKNKLLEEAASGVYQ